MVAAHRTLPAALPSDQARIDGSVWAIGMVRNEQDTITHVVDHLAEQGVDAFLIADNDSTDDTPRLLEELAGRHRLYVVSDRLRAYYQGTKMTMLAEAARRAGADWVVPFDADELWFARDEPLADLLRRSPHDVVRAQLHNVFPSHDDGDDADPFVRLTAFDPIPSPLGKVAARTHRWLSIATGNHAVTRPGTAGDGLFIAHFPWRSYEQVAEKLRAGREAFRDVEDQSIGTHWRRGGELDDRELRETWNDLLSGHPVETLSWSPVGTTEHHRVAAWHSWQAPPG